ncbi:MAG: glycosyltransferase family 4 protein [Planctomycetes bacterium]|nr:glycosyltransferase family 4 protein [Planctomycetota bacterium]
MANVLVFYQYFSTPKGSWGTRYYEFGRRWAAAGHKVTIVTAVYDKSDLEGRGVVSRQQIEGMEIVVVNVKLSQKHSKRARLFSFGAYSALAGIYACVARADVVIASSGPLSVGGLGLLARWVRRRKLIFEARDLLPEVWAELGALNSGPGLAFSRALAKACYLSADTIVALSPGMPERMRDLARNVRIEVIPNAADIDLFGGTGDLPDEIACVARAKSIVLYAGTLGLANSGGEFLDIAAELKRRGDERVQIVLIGDGVERVSLEERATAEALANVSFIDPQPKTTIVEWHRAATAILIGLKPFPILQTSSPNKLFDGLAAGRPILNNTRGWIADLLEADQCGFTHDPGDAAAAADHIQSLVDDPSLGEGMGRRGRSLAEAQFSRDRLANAYMKLFE